MPAIVAAVASSLFAWPGVAAEPITGIAEPCMDALLARTW